MKRKLMLCISLCLLTGILISSNVFAAESVGTNGMDSIELSDVEFELSKDDIDENGHFEIEALSDSTETEAASKGTIEDDASINQAGQLKRKSIIVEGYARKNSWTGTTLELRIGCKATGKLKQYKGTCVIYKANGITKVTSRNFDIKDGNGSTKLSKPYSFRVGKITSCRVALTNQRVVDIYERTGSLISYRTGLIRK